MNLENFILANLEKKASKMFENERDVKDKITMDVPLFIRMLELAREDIKSDAELHVIVDRVLDLKNQGVLTMDDYPYIVQEETPTEKPTQVEDLSTLRRLAGLGK